MRIFALLCLLLLYACNIRPEQPTLTEACHQLKSLDKAKHTAQPGEWLATYGEIQEPFQAYMNRHPPQATTQRNKLYIVQLGALDTTGKQILLATREGLQAFYQLPTAELPPVSLKTIPTTYTRNNSFGLQLQTGVILDSLLPALLPADAFALIAFTDTDLYPDDSWNFVFGQASLERRVGVWSMARLGDYNQNDTLFRLCRNRTLHIAFHETGHMLGITHCVRNECCMNGSNSLAESDRQPSWLCSLCLIKLCGNRQIHPLQHLSAMKAFHENTTGDSHALGYYKKAEALLKQ